MWPSYRKAEEDFREKAEKAVQQSSRRPCIRPMGHVTLVSIAVSGVSHTLCRVYGRGNRFLRVESLVAGDTRLYDA